MEMVVLWLLQPPGKVKEKRLKKLIVMAVEDFAFVKTFTEYA